MRKSQPPKHLSREAGNWWNRIVSEYCLDDQAGKLLLQTAMESFDGMREAQAAVAADGAVIRDRFEQLQPHPMLRVETSSRAQMLTALRALHLDIEPLRDAPGRPPGT